jgi:hypothetical protein
MARWAITMTTPISPINTTNYQALEPRKDVGTLEHQHLGSNYARVEL